MTVEVLLYLFLPVKSTHIEMPAEAAHFSRNIMHAYPEPYVIEDLEYLVIKDYHIHKIYRKRTMFILFTGGYETFSGGGGYVLHCLVTNQ